MNKRNANVLDPFAGSATTLLAASVTGSASTGWESQDLIYRIADAKLQSAHVDPTSLRSDSLKIAEQATAIAPDQTIEHEPELLRRCYSDRTLATLRALDRVLADARPTLDPAIWKLLWLDLLSILRPASHAGTAQWQYVQPGKSKVKTLEVLSGFREKAEQIASDVERTAQDLNGKMSLFEHDARQPPPIPQDSIDLVLTSPPYANNFDYADATRLEMTFLGEVATWSDLRRVRDPLIHACSQHMAGYDAVSALRDPLLNSIVDRLEPIYNKLTEVRATKGGKKAYHSMVVAYFRDMATVWHNLRSCVRPGGKALFVLGDSAPYGIYTPVEIFHGDLAIAAGFNSYSFSKTRDRNIKWKNRKHRVPLKEGVLEVTG